MAFLYFWLTLILAKPTAKQQNTSKNVKHRPTNRQTNDKHRHISMNIGRNRWTLTTIGKKIEQHRQQTCTNDTTQVSLSIFIKRSAMGLNQKKDRVIPRFQLQVETPPKLPNLHHNQQQQME